VTPALLQSNPCPIAELPLPYFKVDCCPTEE
jgi:hypothetical protein